MRVRPATLDDLPTIQAIEARAHGAAHWSENEYARLFEPEPRRVVLIVENIQPEGFLVGKIVGPDCELENIVVSEQSRRRGLGLLLLGSLLDKLRQEGVKAVFLEVRESNAGARMLYKKCGFQQSGSRPGYYRDPPEDAVLYRLLLRQST
jgi:ribosomal-protein-alanine acetyltransferase